MKFDYGAILRAKGDTGPQRYSVTDTGTQDYYTLQDWTSYELCKINKRLAHKLLEVA